MRYQRTCPVCGRRFYASTAKGEYCTGACRTLAYRIRKARKSAGKNPYVTVRIMPNGEHEWGNDAR